MLDSISMITPPPCRIDSIQPSGIEFREPMPGTMGGQFIPLFHSGNKIVIQTPKMESLGCTKWQYNSQSPEKYTFIMRCSSAFVQWCQAIDQCILSKAYENATCWLGREYTLETIRTMFQDTVKEDMHGDPVLKLNVAFRGSDCLVPFFDAQGNVIDMADIPRDEVLSSAIIEIDGLWFLKGKFGIKMKLSQVKFHGATKKYAFLPDDD